jgi:hypothetical protein
LAAHSEASDQKATKRFKDTNTKIKKTDTDFTHYSVNQYILARLASSSTRPQRENGIQHVHRGI